MANPSVDEILNMKSSQLKEFLQDNHVPVPKRQSKEFLQTVALQTHAVVEAEASKNRIITRRRSKREETDHSSTYSGIHGRSSSMPRSSPSHNSSPRSSMTTRSRAQLVYIKTEAESPDVTKQEQVKKEKAAIEPAQPRRHDQEEDISYSSYSALLHAATPSSAPPQILSSIDFNQQIDNAGERGAASPSSKQAHGDVTHHAESAEHAKLSMRADQESPDKIVPQVESMKAIDHETNKKQSRTNQEVVRKIIRVNDEADHQERKKLPSLQYKEGTHVKGHHASDHGGQVSRMQRLKRSGSMIISQVNERVFKRLRKVPNCKLHLARPSPPVSIALLMCAVCVAAIGATSYWYHIKKLEEQRAARKRWLW